MLDWIKANRLKAVAVLAVTGDCFMGMAGVSLSGLFLSLAGTMGLIGHGIMFLWGRGAVSSRPLASPIATSSRPAPVFLKPFLPWRYPLDSSFCIFTIGSIFYILGGLQIGDTALLTVGVLVLSAAVTGWLWPQEKMIFGLRSVQVTALLYMASSLMTLAAALTAANVFLFFGGISYVLCNLILFTVRKEYQSAHTQLHESGN